MKMTIKEQSDALRLIYALEYRMHDERIVNTLVRVLDYCDGDQVRTDVAALAKIADEVRRASK